MYLTWLYAIVSGSASLPPRSPRLHVTKQQYLDLEEGTRWPTSIAWSGCAS